MQFKTETNQISTSFIHNKARLSLRNRAMFK